MELPATPSSTVDVEAPWPEAEGGVLNQDGRLPLKDQLSASELARSFLDEFVFAWAWDLEFFAEAPRARTAKRKRR